MKKLQKTRIILFLTIFIFCINVYAQDEYPEELKAEAKKYSPTLDADIEDCYGEGYEFQGLNDGGVLDNKDDISGIWYALWDDAGLYVAVSVKDDVLDWGEDNLNNAGDGFNGDQWMFDEIEIYVNPTGQRNPEDGSYETANASQIRYNPLDGTKDYNNSGGGYATNYLDELEWVSEEVSGGYVLETLIPWTAILPDPTTIPERIGFTINIKDSDLGADGITPVSNEGFLLWVGAGLSDLQWNNINYFGLLELSDSSCFIPTDNIEYKNEIECNIYPNPAEDYIQVNLPTGIFKIEIYDILGRRMIDGNFENQDLINISNLNTGIYCVKVISDNNIKKLKLYKY